MNIKLFFSLIFVSMMTIFILLPSFLVPWSLIDDGEDLRMSVVTGEHLKTFDANWLLSYEKDNGRFRPAYWLWNYTQFKLFGTNIIFHHLGHVILYCSITILIFLISLKISKSYLAGLIAVGLFLLFTPAAENFYRLGPIEPPITLLYLLYFFCLLKIYFNKFADSNLPIKIIDYLGIFMLLAITYFMKETAVILFVATVPVVFIGLLDTRIKTKVKWLIFGTNILLINLLFLILTLSIKNSLGISGGYASSYTFNLLDTVKRFIVYLKMIIKDYKLFLLIPLLVYLYPLIKMQDKLKLLKRLKLSSLNNYLWIIVLFTWFALFLGIQSPWMYVMGRYLTPVVVWLVIASGIIIVKLFSVGEKSFISISKQNLKFEIPIFKLVFIVMMLLIVGLNGIEILKVYRRTISGERNNQKMLSYLAKNIPPKGTVYLDFNDGIMEYEYEMPIHFKYFYSRTDINLRYLKLDEKIDFKNGDHIIAFTETVRKYPWEVIQDTFPQGQDFGYPYGANWRMIKINNDFTYQGNIAEEKKMKMHLAIDFSGKTINLIKIIPLLLIFLLLLVNLKRIRQRVFDGLEMLNPTQMMVFLPYELKIRQKTNSKVLDFYEFVKKNTPPDAKILIPPTAYPWPMTGNANYSRYFLYPRHLIVGKEKEPGVDLKKENIQYVLVVWGETKSTSPGYTSGWPKFLIPAKKIIYKKPTEQEMNYEKIIIENKDFDWTTIDKTLWGIVEIDRERL